MWLCRFDDSHWLVRLFYTMIEYEYHEKQLLYNFASEVITQLKKDITTINVVQRR